MNWIKKLVKLKIENFMTYFIKYLMERYEMDARIDNLKYEIADAMERKEIFFPQIISELETLKVLISERKSICRFGDGEFSIIRGGLVKFQSFHPTLAMRLHEILISEDESIMIGIPDSMGCLDRFKNSSKQWARAYYGCNREAIYKLLDFEKVYYDAGVTRPYLNKKDKSIAKTTFSLFPKLWEDREVVFIEGEYTRAGVGNDLFNMAKSVERIICPNFDAFDVYNEILASAIKLSKEKLILISLGPTATVLAYDLAKLGFQAVDLGHLDIEYEWFRKGVENVSPIQGKYVNESDKSQKSVFTVSRSKEYQRQIIDVISNSGV